MREGGRLGHDCCPTVLRGVWWGWGPNSTVSPPTRHRPGKAVRPSAQLHPRLLPAARGGGRKRRSSTLALPHHSSLPKGITCIVEARCHEKMTNLKFRCYKKTWESTGGRPQSSGLKEFLNGLVFIIIYCRVTTSKTVCQSSKSRRMSLATQNTSGLSCSHVSTKLLDTQVCI